jgi:CMP-N-acetylneuraminic acid synthetase
MKNIKDILFITTARLQSQRVPRKMIKPFANTTLLDIMIDKIKNSKYINQDNFYLSVHEEELVELAKNKNVKYFRRSLQSSLAENNIPLFFEWHDKLPFKYVVLLSACNPLLKIETIDNFIEKFLNSDKQGGFGVIAKKQYFWDSEGKMISEWPEGQKIMNTKHMNVTYEAAHCLYASRMDIIGEGYWMDKKTPPEPELFVIKNEIEAFDIDEPWQFNLGEKLYEDFSNSTNNSVMEYKSIEELEWKK